MRGLLEGHPSSAPLAAILPAMLREDAFARQLCTGLDEVLTPVLVSLDSFAAYLDVGTTPDDMLPWLGQWLGVSLDPRQEPDAQRELLGLARELHTVRGTRAGVALAVRTALGIEVSVSETGASSWSESAGGNLPGEAIPRVVVKVVGSPGPNSGGELDLERLDAVIQSALPAHVRYRVQVSEN
jgi:phage tail-like protein